MQTIRRKTLHRGELITNLNQLLHENEKLRRRVSYLEHRFKTELATLDHQRGLLSLPTLGQVVQTQSQL